MRELSGARTNSILNEPMPRSLSRTLCGMAAIFFHCSVVASSLDLVTNLQKDFSNAKHDDSVLLIMVTLPDCDVCDYVKSHHVLPLINPGSSNQNLVVKELDLLGEIITDFNGLPIMPEQFAARYGAKFSPSILFLDSTGQQLRNPLIGVESYDYYGYYFDKAINESFAQIEDKPIIAH